MKNNLFVFLLLFAAGCTSNHMSDRAIHRFVLDYNTSTDSALQSELQFIDAKLRGRYSMTPEQTAVGILDFKTLRVAMIHPDRMEYAASIPKIGILLAYFQLHPEAAEHLDQQTRHELGLMIKASSNEMASKFSGELGLKQIQQVISSAGFYDENRGGGIWVGKHYGKGGERIGDPLGDNSHAATVRQLLRFYLLLEQQKLVSRKASLVMREIFDSPEIPHDNIKFVKALQSRGVTMLRKWGTWENWCHDSAEVIGPNRHYVLVALTQHPKGDDYLVDLAKSVDDLMSADQN